MLLLSQIIIMIVFGLNRYKEKLIVYKGFLTAPADKDQARPLTV